MVQEKAQIVVVGGGVLGCAVAWHLARLGAGRVVLLERHELGAGATSRAAAILNRLHPKEGQTALAIRTRADLLELEAELEEPLGLRSVGNLYLASSDKSAIQLDELQQLAESWQVPWRELDRIEAERRVPWLDASAASRLLLLPDEGFLDPYILTNAFARAAHARAVELRTNTAVTGLVRAGGRVIGVRTAAGELHADCTVLTTGPWAGLLAAEAGWQLPMAPVRSHYWISAADPAFPPDHPCVILPDANAYTRPELGGLLFGLRSGRGVSCDPRDLPDDLSELRFGGEPDGLESLLESGPGLEAFFPRLCEVGLAHYIAGPSTYTPDGQPVLGALPGVEGVLVGAGCCGSGIALSGGVGRALAELALGREPSFELAPTRAGRFGPQDAFSPAFRERCIQARAAKTRA